MEEPIFKTNIEKLDNLMNYAKTLMKIRTLSLLALTLTNTPLSNGAITLTSVGNSAPVGSSIAPNNSTSGRNTIDHVSFDYNAMPGELFNFPQNFTKSANITNITAPTGELVDGVSLSMNDLFDGPSQMSLTITAYTDLGNSLSFNLAEGVDGKILIFSDAAIFTSYTTQLNTDDAISTPSSLSLGQDSLVDDLALTFRTSDGEAIIGFDIDYDLVKSGTLNEGFAITGVSFSTSPIDSK